MIPFIRFTSRPRRTSSVRRRLVQLVAAIAVPLVLLAAISLCSAYATERQRQENALLSRAEAAVAMVDRDFESATWALRTLAGSNSLIVGNLDLFEAKMRRTSAVLDGAMIILTDPNGNAVLSTVWAPGERRQGLRANSFIQGALRSRVPQISDLVVHPESNRMDVGVAIPVSFGPGGSTDWNLSLYLPASTLATTLADLHLPPDWLASVIDRQGTWVARTREEAVFVGRQLPEEQAKRIAEAPNGLTGTHRSADGVPTVTASARSPRTGFLVAIGIPEAVLLAPIKASLTRTAVIASLLIGLSIVGALLLSRRIVTALQKVANAEPGTAPVSGLREVDELAQAIAAAEAQREETAEGVRLLAETVPGWVFMTDGRGEHVYVNSTFMEQTGQSDFELMGDGWLSVVHPDDIAAVRQAWARALRTGQEFTTEYRCLMREGGYRWMLTRTRPLCGADGTAVRWFGVAVDVTALRDAEGSLRAANETLEARVCAEVAARNAAQARAAQAERLQALGQLAGGIAHDFNNVLQATQGAATIIDRRPENTTSVRRMARMILDAAGRGASITGRLLTFSRQGELHAEAVEPACLLRGMQHMLVHTIGSGIEVLVDASPDLPPLLADKGQLETVLVNLATNARDAMSGTGTLRFAASIERIQPGGATNCPVELQPGTYVCLAVGDTGVGMDAATLARASEPFFTTKAVGKGTGLGLAMARGFAEQSGGALLVESEPGRGTVVRLWLPVASDRPEADKQERPMTSSGRLLMVDDDTMVLETLSEVMRQAGFTVTPMATATAALDLLETGDMFDLVVSDLSMPGMDGVAFIKAVHRLRPGLPAILLTGYATNAAEIATGGAMSGAFSLLRKPIEGRALAERAKLLIDEQTKARTPRHAVRAEARA